MNYIVGTAGHVDHGKSTLITALTGMAADRLAEEQRREMTIDLGFTWLALPSGRIVSLIDVPGHERFIKNMLAGVGGVDAALVIIAADEGVMPQTIEHLHILELLEIELGIVVLTKRDLVDEEWLLLVEEDVRARLSQTQLVDAPIIAVSARTGAGIPELQQALDTVLARVPEREDAHGRPRMPVDRVFTVGGFGTVVTGTLLDGPLHVGQEVEFVPSGVRARTRGLQVRHDKLDRAEPGSRVAANIAGISTHDVRRGQVMTVPGSMAPSTMIDLKLRVLEDAPAIEHNMLLDLFVGSAEVSCHVALLEHDQLDAGSSGWVQLRLMEPIAASRGDRCIVRIPSPSQTVGGGRVVDAYPARHRRFRPDVVAALETLSRGTPADIVEQTLRGLGPQLWETASKRVTMSPELSRSGIQDLINQGRIIVLADPALSPNSIIITTSDWTRIIDNILAILAVFHTSFPLRMGMAKESLRQKIGLTNAKLFIAVLTYASAQRRIVQTETLVHKPDWRPRLTAEQQQAVNLLLRSFNANPFSPPSRSEWEPLGTELIAWLLETGQLVRVSSDVLFTADGYAKLVEWTEAQLSERGEITVAQLRDAFNTSRKYALAFLEHLDERRITKRVGEARTKY
ncbi:MAG: selenocysteine-specific translation elongation factor [Herpetosiphon sp.]